MVLFTAEVICSFIYSHIAVLHRFWKYYILPIALRSAGYRLVYQVFDDRVVVVVVAVGKREHDLVYSRRGST